MAAPATQVNGGDVPNFKIVERLDGVPAIHDSLAYAQTLINSTQITGQLYATASALASKSYDMATPVLVKTKPLLESADGLAVATFDRAQATFPYPFKTPTEDLIVVKQAKAVYDERLAPMFHSAAPAIQDALNKTMQINSALGARAIDAVHQSQELTHALYEQLKQLAAHGTEIPGAMLERAQKVTEDVKGILFAKENTIEGKTKELGAYAIDQVKPVVDEIYNYVLGAKNKAQEEASKSADKVNGAVHDN